MICFVHKFPKMIKIPQHSNLQDYSETDSFRKKLQNLNESSCIELQNEWEPKRKKGKGAGLNKKVIISLNPKEAHRQSSNSQTNVGSLRSPFDDFIEQKNKLKMRQNFALTRRQTIQDVGDLRKMIKHHKVANINQNFVKKLKRNSIYRKPVIFQPFDFSEEINQNALEGIVFPHHAILIFHILSSIFTLAFCFIATLLMAFPAIYSSEYLRYIEIYGIIWILIEIGINFTRVTHIDGQNIKRLKQISLFYIKNKLWIDSICLISLILNFTVNHQMTMYLNLLFFFKVPDCTQKISKLETRLISTFYMEQYWGLMKLIFRNFLFAHIIALFLIIMSWLDQKQNWVIQKDLMHAPWYEQYVWSYYWATTIMLTVGFGDISASNYQEAICLIFIETISCMTLAYNINCVGNLISQLRERSVEKDSSLKVLRNMTEKNKISGDLQFKLKNHVEESYHTQVKQDFEKETQLVCKLPQNLKEEYLCAANSDMFYRLFFFRNLTNKTISRVAQKIEAALSHPGEIFTETNSFAYILKEGKIGYFPNFNNGNSKINKIAIDEIIVQENKTPALISLQFLAPNVVRNFQVKSIGYSIMFHINMNTLKELLKNKSVDYQHFFIIKDKEKNHFDEFEVIPCNFCGKNFYHSKFRCPKLHYMPIRQLVILKQFHSEKTAHNSRKAYPRLKSIHNPFLIYKLRTVQKHDITDNFTDCEAFNVTDLSIKIPTKMSYRPAAFFETRREKSELGRTKIILKAAEQMKKEMENLFYHEGQGDFWDLQCDIAKDYVYYFRDSNPKKLGISLKKSKILKVKKSLSSNNMKRTDG